MYGEYDVQTTDGVIHVLQNLNNSDCLFRKYDKWPKY